MIKFKLSPEPVWVSGDHSVFDSSEIGSYPKEERAKVKFLISPLTRQLVKELVNKHTSRKPIEIPSDMDESFERFIELTGGLVQDFDEVGYQNDVIDSIIKDWKVYDENHVLIKCNRENKLALFNGGYPLLAACVIKIARELMAKFELYQSKTKEKSEKNLSSLQSGLQEEGEK